MWRISSLIFLFCLVACGNNGIAYRSAASHTKIPKYSPTPDPIAGSPNGNPSNTGNVDVTDPWSIELAIDGSESVDLRPIWKKLGLEDSFNGLHGWEPPKDFLTTCKFCKVDVHEFDLDNEPGDEMLLGISNSLEYARYLVFKRQKDVNPNYQLLGTIDHSFGRYKMPDHYFLVGAGRSFLGVKVQTQSGSGVAMYTNRLFTLSAGKLLEIANFPHRGHQNMYWNGMGVDREFRGKVADIRRVGDAYFIEVGLTVSYGAWTDTSFPLWSKNQKAMFRWSPRTKQAIFVPSLSTVTKHELESVYDVDTLSDKEFAQFNKAEIRDYLRKNKTPTN